MGACSGDEPVVVHGIEKGTNVFARFRGKGFQQIDDVSDPGAAVALILAGRLDAESLACVLLMDALPDIPGLDPVVAFDDNGDLILEAHDFRICDGEPDGASQL